jgi:inhibitor of cysteine peptidase
MKKLKILCAIFGAVSLLAFTGCNSVPTAVSVNDSSSGKKIEIAVNGTLTISLNANATTGFTWQLTDNTDPEVLQLTDNSYHTTIGGQLGGEGKQIWTFTTLKPGITTLTMDYSQSWADGQKSTQSFTLTVLVE